MACKILQWTYSKQNKRSHETDVPRFANLKDWFGNYPAEELTPKEIEGRLAKAAEKEKWAPPTFNHYRSFVSLSFRLERTMGRNEKEFDRRASPLHRSSS